MSITKEDLKKLTLRDVKEVEIKGIGKVRIRPCSLKIRHDARMISMDADGNIDTEKFTAYIIIHCLVEPKLDLSDISMISDLPTGIGDELISEIYKLSGIINGEELKK